MTSHQQNGISTEGMSNTSPNIINSVNNLTYKNSDISSSVIRNLASDLFDHIVYFFNMHIIFERVDLAHNNIDFGFFPISSTILYM